MTDITATDTLTITLTDRRPVSIVKADWPVIALAKGWDNEYESQSDRTWRMTVRQHADGRAVVYGVYSSEFQGERDARAGQLCAPGADLAVVIKDVARACRCEDIADECIADLPAEKI